MQPLALMTALAVFGALALFQFWCRMEDQVGRERLKR